MIVFQLFTGVTGSAAGQRVLIGLREGPLLSPEDNKRIVEQAVIRLFAGEVEHRYRFINVILAQLPEEALPELATNPYIRFIEPDGEVAAP
ncbi:MAG TPA: hypothetical protein EYP17_04700, partial [Candidatus Latescibacteria bacterium]|nr:hypothetical protein [Candidatus Latescibacterota bacterium]